MTCGVAVPRPQAVREALSTHAIWGQARPSPPLLHPNIQSVDTHCPPPPRSDLGGDRLRRPPCAQAPLRVALQTARPEDEDDAYGGTTRTEDDAYGGGGGNALVAVATVRSGRLELALEASLEAGSGPGGKRKVVVPPTPPLPPVLTGPAASLLPY